MFPLAFEVEGVNVIATRSRRVYVIRGLLGVLLLPVLFALLVVLIGVAMFEESPDATMLAVWAALAGASVLWGLVLIVFSRRLSRRGAVTIDRARGVVSAGGIEHSLDGVDVRVRKLEGISGWNTIELWRGQRLAIVHDRLQPMHASDVTAHAEYLAQILGGAPLVAAPDAAFGPTPQRMINDNTAAMLCYLPVQGIHLIASLYYLVTAHDRPYVRFAAKQSLTQTGVMFASLLVFGCTFGVPLSLVDDSLKVVFGVLLGVSLGVVAIANIVAHVIACVRAQSGKLWVIPWLRPIVTKWLP